MSRVANKIVIVTGASLGLGAASARMLAREGAAVVLTDIKDEEGQALRAPVHDGHDSGVMADTIPAA